MEEGIYGDKDDQHSYKEDKTRTNNKVSNVYIPEDIILIEVPC